MHGLSAGDKQRDNKQTLLELSQHTGFPSCLTILVVFYQVRCIVNVPGNAVC